MQEDIREAGLSHQRKVKCYGRSAGLCAEQTISPAKRDALPLPTINLEVAPRQGAQMDWSRKIVVQLSDSELPQVCALLLGYQRQVELKRPGKGIDIERQAENLFVKATAGAGNLFPLPIGPGDVFRLSALFLEQLQRQSGLTDGALIIAAIRGASTWPETRLNN